MSNRREKINQLRQQVTKMQNDLKNLENGETQKSAKWNIITHIRQLSINKSKDRSQNHSKDSRKISKQNRSPSERKSFKGYLTCRNQEKSEIQHNLSQTLKDIINKIDDSFYAQKKTPKREHSESPSSYNKAIFNKTSYIGQRYQFNNYAERRVESKESKIRTYNFKPTDTIINPEKQQFRGIKIVKKIERSPDNMLSNNPKSNPNLYLFNTQPVFIHKKNHFQDKNKSSLVLSPSTLHIIPSKSANSQEKQMQTQKKHFERHIEENICSKYKTSIS